jgi:hypothetical protein
MTQIQPATPRDAAVETDALSHLYKMSSTAGAQSNEYVAVNVTAVVAVIFGLASLLAKFGAILLVIPIIGVILSLVALAQIRASNGTQTGKGLALIGLILSGLISGGLLTVNLVQAAQTRSDEQAISAICQDLGQLLKDRKYESACALFNARFKDRVGDQAFTAHLANIQQNGYYPPIDSMTWNGRSEIQSGDEGEKTAAVMMVVQYKDSNTPSRFAAELRRTDGTWRFEAIEDLFPTQTKSSRAVPQ